MIVGFLDAANKRYVPNDDALGVSNWLTTEKLPTLIGSGKNTTSEDPENFRLFVKDPALNIPNAPPPTLTLTVERNGVVVITNTYTLIADADGGEFRSLFLRLVADSEDDKASGVGPAQDPDDQTILVELGDKVKVTYGDAASAELSVGRTLKDKERPKADADRNFKHQDIREVKINVVVFQDPTNNLPYIADQALTNLIADTNRALAQVGLRLKVTGRTVPAGVPLPAANNPATPGIDWTNDLQLTKKSGTDNIPHPELVEILKKKDADRYSIDVFFTPILDDGPGSPKDISFYPDGVRATYQQGNGVTLRNNILMGDIIPATPFAPPELAHEIMHILMNIGHDTDPADNAPQMRRFGWSGKEDQYSLFNHSLSPDAAVDAKKRIMPYKPSDPAAAGVVGSVSTPQKRVFAKWLGDEVEMRKYAIKLHQ